MRRELDPLGAGVGHESRAGPLCAREIRLERALLGAGAAAVAAEAGAHTAVGIQPRAGGGPAKRARAAQDDAVVRGVRVLGDLARVRFRFDAVEVGREIRGAHPFDAVVVGPFVEHPIRGAVHDHPVDRGASAHDATLKERDAEVGGRTETLIGVEPRKERAFLLVEFLAGDELPRFDHQHIEPFLGESCGGDRPTSTCADHHNLGAQHLTVDHERGEGRGERSRAARGRRVGRAQDRLGVRRHSGKRSLPRHSRPAQVIRPAISHLAHTLGRRILRLHHEASQPLDHGPENRESRTGPGQEQRVLRGW